MIKERLVEAMGGILSSALNFLGGLDASKVKVTRGGNSIALCYQYVVKDCSGEKLLGVKIYDKVMDLVGREYRHAVGSRIF